MRVIESGEFQSRAITEHGSSGAVVTHLVSGKGSWSVVQIRLEPYEALMVMPDAPHGVLGGRGPIEHFVLRMPARQDRRTVGAIPTEPLWRRDENERELRATWGCRVPLAQPTCQNCWLFGFGRAMFHSDHMCLAYLNFPDAESLDADRHAHRSHFHRESLEYYVVLRGMRSLEVENKIVAIDAGTMLAVSPGTRHVLFETCTPFEGITFRVPLVEDKVESDPLAH